MCAADEGPDQVQETHDVEDLVNLGGLNSWCWQLEDVGASSDLNRH